MEKLPLILSALKQGVQAKKHSIFVPNTKFLYQIIVKLHSLGLIMNFCVHSRKLEIFFSHCKGETLLRQFSLVSTSTLPRFVNVTDLKRLEKKMPQTIILLSTTAGILTSTEAQVLNVGGLLLFFITV